MVYTTGIPRPGALDDLVGSSSTFVHVCCTYIQCACTSAWKLAPQGLIHSTMLFIYFLFFLIKHLKPINIYMNFDILKQKRGKGQTFKV